MKKRIFYVTIVMITMVSLLNILFNYQIKFVIDSLVVQDKQQFYILILQMIIIMIIMLFCEFIRQVMNQKYLNAIGYELQHTILGKIFNTFLPNRDIISEINNDIEMIKSDYYDTIFSLYQGVVSFLIASIALFVLDALTALWIIIVSLFPLIIPYLYKKRRIYLQESISKNKKLYIILLNNILDGATVIKNCLKTTHFYDEMDDSYKHINYQLNQKAVISASINVLVGLFFYLTIMVILFVGGMQILEGQTTVGTLSAIYSVTAELVVPIELISESISRIDSVKGILINLTKNNYVFETNKVVSTDFYKITIRSFQYEITPSKWITIPNFTIQANHNYLIRGASGIGKSTLGYLLTKNYVSHNSIFLNDRDLFEYSYEEIQKIISFIPQNPILFQDTIWNNITMFEDVEEREVLELIEEMGLQERFPDRMSLMNEVYMHDSDLSGGQKQRIVLIRALLQHRPILLVDEGLSALDNNFYNKIESYLLKRECTFVHISHRNTCHAYDEVITLM